jgi:hypothetical protein
VAVLPDGQHRWAGGPRPPIGALTFLGAREDWAVVGKKRSLWQFCQGLGAGVLVGYVAALRAPAAPQPAGPRTHVPDRPVPVGEEQPPQRAPELPGPAAARRMQAHDGQERVIAKRQMAILFVLLILTVVGTAWGWDRIKYEAPPLVANADSPQYRLSVPGKVASMRFDVTDVFTTVELGVSEWPNGEAMTVSSESGDIELLKLNATSRSGESIGAGGWTTDTDERGTFLQLVPRLATPPTKVSIVLRNGRLTQSGQFQFLRTRRVDVEAADGLPGSASGVVTVNTGSYSVERLATGGKSQPGETESTTTRYSVSTSRVLGSHRDALPVPSVSIDMVDVQQQRGRDALLLVLGAVLGALGALIIEMGLTAAHLFASPGK